MEGVGLAADGKGLGHDGAVVIDGAAGPAVLDELEAGGALADHAAAALDDHVAAVTDDISVAVSRLPGHDEGVLLDDQGSALLHPDGAVVEQTAAD